MVTLDDVKQAWFEGDVWCAGATLEEMASASQNGRVGRLVEAWRALGDEGSARAVLQAFLSGPLLDTMPESSNHDFLERAPWRVVEPAEAERRTARLAEDACAVTRPLLPWFRSLSPPAWLVTDHEGVRAVAAVDREQVVMLFDAR